MKYNTFMEYPCTADYYDFTVTEDGAGNATYNYSYDRSVKVKFVLDDLKNATVYCEESLTTLGRLDNIKDPAGTLIAPADGVDKGHQFQVQEISPQVNPLGYAESLRYRLRRV